MNAQKGMIYLFLIFFSSCPLFALPSSASPSKPTTTTVTKAQFPQKLTLGTQQWELGNNEEDDNLQLAEYVTGGEKVADWTQLVTFQKFKFAINKQVTPAMFAQSEIDELKKQKYKVDAKIINSNPQEAIMEFRIQEPV